MQPPSSSQLYLFPNLLTEEGAHSSFFPSSMDAAVAQISALIAESEKGARHFLRRFTFPSPKTFREIPIYLLNEHTTEKEKRELIQEMGKGGIWGLISDCGMPCLADPGADFVLMAREKGIPIETFAGPCSILLALVLSGLGGQHFTFHGYLPKEEPLLIQELKRIEKLSQKEGSTHLFIETPYRNQRMLETLLRTLSEITWICLATDLTSPSQFVETKRVKQWKHSALPSLNKRPTVFALKS